MKWNVLGMILLMGIVIKAEAQKERTRKAVLVIVDGVPADLIEKLSLPNFELIKKAGGFTHAYVGGKKGAYSQTPTISAVGYNSVLTGTWVNKHNVWDNDIDSPNYSYPTIFRLFKERYPERKTAIFSTWLDNRTKLVGDRLPATGNFAVDIHFDGLELDTISYPHDKKSEYLNRIDSAVTGKAAATIHEKGPDLSWVYLEFTDDMGHAFGDGDAYYTAIKEADRRVGLLWKEIQYREANFAEDWLLVVTTDHGRDAATGKNHGGQSERERSGWILTNAKDLNKEFETPQASIVDIMPTIARFLKIQVPQAIDFELDGYPLTGKLSFINAKFEAKEGEILISWQPLTEKGELKVLFSPTNNFKTGGKDKYQLLQKIPVSAGTVRIKLPATENGFYKMVLQGDRNSANGWPGQVLTK